MIHSRLTTLLRGSIAVLCAVALLSAARPAEAGTNVWTRQRNGYIHRLSIVPGRPTVLYTSFPGVETSYISGSTDGGKTWPHFALFDGSLVAIAADPQTPTTLYAGIEGPHAGRGRGLRKSVDVGSTWSAAATGLVGDGVFALAIDPIMPTTLYAGTDNGVFKSTDEGSTWSAANTGLPVTELGTSFVNVIAIDPLFPATLYAGLSTFGVSLGLFKSIDAGDTWNAADAGLPDDASIRVLAIDPLETSTLYASTGSGFFTSIDGGNTWNPRSITLLDRGGIITGLAIDPHMPSTLYASTWSGSFSVLPDRVSKSTDSGITWNSFNIGIDAPGVHSLAIDPVGTPTLYAGTRDGLFSIQIGVCAGDCRGENAVAINDVITMVNIALGTAQPAACANGLPNGRDVDIAVIIEAVSNALEGCD